MLVVVVPHAEFVTREFVPGFGSEFVGALEFALMSMFGTLLRAAVALGVRR